MVQQGTAEETTWKAFSLSTESDGLDTMSWL